MNLCSHQFYILYVTTFHQWNQNIQVNKSTDTLLRSFNSRANSARANLQSHPCFQSSLFNDKERAAGSLKTWKERLAQEKLPSIERTLTQNETIGRPEQGKELNKDYELQNVIWAESVILDIFLIYY